jgi:hypothetical protein
VFNEISADFQPVTVQGQLTYRVADPELVAGLFDYRVDVSVDRYLSEDPEKLPQRLVAARTDNARAEADAQSNALQVSLRPLTELNRDLLQMLAFQSMEPRRMVSLALKEIAQNAARIGNLNISPDLLENLLRDDDVHR